MVSKFLENKDGVHLSHPVMDFTLCGDTNDGDNHEHINIDPLVVTQKRVVTCRRCMQIIKWCRGIRIK